MEDIRNKDDIRSFVDEFYRKVRQDTLIGPVFAEVITGDWQPHLDKMYAFWNGVLFGVPGFKGNPFARHAPLIIGQEHFDQWLILFTETIEAGFSGPVAEEAVKRAHLIAQVFVSKLTYRGE
ncbi:MAG: group III truncated hemoglobin [Pedobacter sp.]|jgi:hemoglobin|uniref:group III truncated hemoglobin n=1 Tax=Pedobacter sp. TaxID=1411316 RepID=UPI00339797EF